MKKILTFVLAALAALMLITARAALVPACPPQMMNEVMALLADKTDDEKLAVLVSTLDEFLKGGGGYSRVFIDDATNAVVEEINGEMFGETPDIFTPEYLEMLRASMLEDMVTDYIGKFNILDLAVKTGRNVEARMNFGKGNTLTIATFSPEQVAEALHNYQPSQPAIEGDVVDFGIKSNDDNFDEVYDMLDTVPTVETLVMLARLMDLNIAESGDTIGNVWIDEESKRVVLLMVGEEFAGSNEMDEGEMETAKHLFLGAYKQIDDFSYVMHYFFLTAARVGFDFEIRLCDEHHLDSPLVWVFTPKEIFDAFSE
ncbi:MAG: hypothetical protein IKW85_10310 [Muribaculaceae bacterium]|nr:hypothetical protein [Muribaculaceae bacterium]